VMTDPLTSLTGELQRLHRHAGEPSTHKIAKETGYSHTTVAKALKGDTCPSWAVLSGIVTTLGGNVEQFRSHWIAVRDSQQPLNESPLTANPSPDTSEAFVLTSRTSDVDSRETPFISDHDRNIMYRNRIAGRAFLVGPDLQDCYFSAEDEGFQVAILLADVDNLTQINKRCGMKIGDAVLETCRELLIATPAVSFGGRAGDDTFFAISRMPDYGNIKMAGRIAAKYVTDVSGFPWARIEKDLRVTCSVGYSVIPFDERAFDTAVRAVIGFNEAKKKGGNQACEGPYYLAPLDRSEGPVVRSERQTYSPVNRTLPFS
jgi:GGDEF domain-containing protein